MMMSIAYIVLQNDNQANVHFERAKSDGFIELFVEHEGAPQDMAETYLRKTEPELCLCGHIIRQAYE